MKKTLTFSVLLFLYSFGLTAGGWTLHVQYNINGVVTSPDEFSSFCLENGDVLYISLWCTSTGNGSPPLTCFSVIDPMGINYSSPNGQYSYTQNGQYRIYFNCPTPQYELKRTFYVQCAPLTVLDQIPSTGVTIWPNPFNDHLNISVDEGTRDELSIRIFSLDGRLLIEKQHNGSISCSLETAALPAGIYIAEIDHEGIITRQKIFKAGT
ncbi:MAG TPA: T9SS type A sorting domain-containing protein [Bacteroidia bacterium]|nr:T9SS type A sorting domain-containing protein [Bacteroidia bacterium]